MSTHPAAGQVVLTGPPGAGKTTVADLLARALGLPVLDTDAMVERTAGCPVSEIFVRDGEPRFRALEREAVARALAAGPAVVSLGGGAVMDPVTRAALAPHTVVFLDVQLPEAARRIGFNRDRPLLLANPRAQWAALMQQRRPVYTEVADLVVDTSALEPQAVAEAVLAHLAGGPAPGRAPSEGHDDPAPAPGRVAEAPHTSTRAPHGAGQGDRR